MGICIIGNLQNVPLYQLMGPTVIIFIAEKFCQEIFCEFSVKFYKICQLDGKEAC